MIKGIGVDTVSVARIAEAMLRPRFLARLLTPTELASRPEWSPQTVAGRWAAKEAAAKANPSWHEWHAVEIFNAPDGRPYLVPREPQLGTFWVSISHEHSHATAMVVWETNSSEPA